MFCFLFWRHQRRLGRCLTHTQTSQPLHELLSSLRLSPMFWFLFWRHRHSRRRLDRWLTHTNISTTSWVAKHTDCDFIAAFTHVFFFVLEGPQPMTMPMQVPNTHTNISTTSWVAKHKDCDFIAAFTHVLFFCSGGTSADWAGAQHTQTSQPLHELLSSLLPSPMFRFLFWRHRHSRLRLDRCPTHTHTHISTTSWVAKRGDCDFIAGFTHVLFFVLEAPAQTGQVPNTHKHLNHFMSCWVHCGFHQCFDFCSGGTAAAAADWTGA